MLVTTVVLANVARAGVLAEQLEVNVIDTGDVTRAELASTILTETVVDSPSVIDVLPRLMLLSLKLAPLPVPMRNGVIDRLPLAIGSMALTVSRVAVMVSDV